MGNTGLSDTTYDKYASAVTNGSIKDCGLLPDIFSMREIEELYDEGYVWIDTWGRFRVIAEL